MDKAKPNELEFAEIDFDRLRRQGMPEVIFGAGKTAGQISAIVSALRDAGQSPVLVTKLDDEKAKALESDFGGDFSYCREGRIGRLGAPRAPDGAGEIVVVTAGTSDIPVAMEAIFTAETLGNRVRGVFDVGVAGIHRLLGKAEILRGASVLIVVAGMEGALASVAGGLVSCPVVAVPTSIGYGASFSGLSALLSMLNSCAAGVSVVNIDNGFGAAVAASRINHVGR